VLIKSSLERQEDCLEGLKENVIIGKLIPAEPVSNMKKKTKIKINSLLT